MKNLKPTLLIVLSITIFFSCTSDNSLNDDSALTVGSLLGAWRLTASSQNGVSIELTECDLSDLIIFDKTKLMYVFNKSGSGTKCSIDILKKDYTVRDNIITEDDGTEIIIQQIYTMEPSSLILEFEDTYDDEVVVYRETYVKRL